jgi:KipI family sensor histidine kinase inhibitor
VKRAEPRIARFGDAALLVEWPEAIDPAINRLVHALAELISADRKEGTAWRTPVPAYASLLAAYDPLGLEPNAAERQLAELLARLHELWQDAPAEEELPLLEIPVRYGGDEGPDLDEVARRTGLGPAGVIELHSSQPYRTYLLGFAPGFAYLGSLPRELQLPRRDTPRRRVPAGSVAIAGAQTAVYPLSTPGGWHLIGRTDLRPWDIEREPPALIRPGQSVRFVPLAG